MKEIDMEKIAQFSRRGFIKTAGTGALALACTPLWKLSAAAAPGTQYIYGGASEPQNLDPHIIIDVNSDTFRLNLYDSLYRYEDNPPKLYPWLAESYSASTDGLTWTFKLRRGVKFHNGDALTADDVIYSMKRLLSLGKGAAALFKPVVDPEASKALDPYTVQFKLKEAYAPFISIIPNLAVVNPRQLEGKPGKLGTEWLSKNDAGSGSFSLTAYNPGTGWKGERFKDHWMGWKDPHVERLEFRTIHETASRVMALMKGDIQACDGYLPAEQLKKLEDCKDVVVMEEQSMRTFVIRMHNQRAPFNDVHIRRAISYAFDYDAFNNEVLKGKVARNPGPIPNNMWGAPADLKGYTYDLDKAKAELKKAKVKITRPLQVHAMNGFSQTDDAALILQAGLEQLGIKLKIVRETWPTLSSKAKNKDTSPDMWIHWVSTYYADPENWIGEMYSTSRWGAWKASSWYNNPEVDKILKVARTTSDQVARKEMYEKASRMIVDDAADIWIYNTKWYGPHRKTVKGFRFCPVGSGQEVRWISVG